MLACVLYKTTDMHMSPERKKNELNIDTVLPPVLYWSKGGASMEKVIILLIVVLAYIGCNLYLDSCDKKKDNKIAELEKQIEQLKNEGK